MHAEGDVLDDTVDEESRRAAHVTLRAALHVLAHALQVDLVVHLRGEARHVEIQTFRVRAQVGHREMTLVLEQQVMHLPELALSTRRFRCLCGMHCMRMRRLDREMPENEADASAESLEHELDGGRGLFAGGALEVAVLDDSDGRVLGTYGMIDGGNWECEVDAAHASTLLAWQIEDQHLRVASVLQLQLLCVAQFQCIARFECGAVDSYCATRNVYIDQPAWRNIQRCVLRAVEQADIDARVLVNQHGAVALVRRRDHPQASALLCQCEALLFVTRLDALHVRLNPDLQEVHQVRRRRIELAVTHAAAGAHALHVAGTDGRAVAYRVAMCELAGEHVADDLHVAVTVRAEALAGRDAILVDHAQRAELDVVRIEVVGERERVIRLEPAVIGIAALEAATDFLHDVYSRIKAGLKAKPSWKPMSGVLLRFCRFSVIANESSP